MTNEDRERARAELWTRVYASIAAAFGQKQDVAVRWADQALREFDVRFPKT